MLTVALAEELANLLRIVSFSRSLQKMLSPAVARANLCRFLFLSRSARFFSSVLLERQIRTRLVDEPLR